MAALLALPEPPTVSVEGRQLRLDGVDPSDNPRFVRALVLAGAAVRLVTEETSTLEQVYLEQLGSVRS